MYVGIFLALEKCIYTRDAVDSHLFNITQVTQLGKRRAEVRASRSRVLDRDSLSTMKELASTALIVFLSLLLQ